ncbi:hypothetical protein D3C85_1617110 [compost metagenome]
MTALWYLGHSQILIIHLMLPQYGKTSILRHFSLDLKAKKYLLANGELFLLDKVGLSRENGWTLGHRKIQMHRCRL